MLLVKLQGGLGNQMFQYAVARSLLKSNQNIYLDHHFLENHSVDTDHFTAREYELYVFKNIDVRKAAKYQINFFLSQSFFFKKLRVLAKSTVKLIQQKQNEYIPLDSYTKYHFLYLDGYFQSPRYFKHLRSNILQEFHFPELDPQNESIKKKILNALNAVSVHFRRGDYLKSTIVTDIHGVLPISYYDKALNILQAKYPLLNLFVFSDDIIWAKDNLNRDRTTIQFIDQNKASDSWKDMALMSFCKHHVIANSSFSWWGAWLSQNNGDVFAPSNWFNPVNIKFNIDDFIPDNWIIIDNE